MRALIVGIVALGATAGTAHAENEPGVIVGRGSLWGSWRPPMLRFELGVVENRTRLGATTGYDEDGGMTGILPEGGAVTGRGGTFRTVVGLRGVYFAIEASFATVREAPVVVAPTVERMLDGESSPTRSMMFDVRVPIGVERRYGRLMVGGEVAIGVGGVTLGSGPNPTDPFVSDVRGLLDARARAGVWLTRHLSVSAVAGISMVRSDEHSFALMVGGSLFAWDGVP